MRRGIKNGHLPPSSAEGLGIHGFVYAPSIPIGIHGVVFN
jgi:hypothetical protein